MNPIRLQRHPKTASSAPTPWVRLGREGRVLRMTFRMPGDTSMVELPAPIDPLVKQSKSRRSDRLWEHTCFECFVRAAGGDAYYEFNFSPSQEWAAYQFNGVRQGMRNADVDCPAIVATHWANRFELSAMIVLPLEWQDLIWQLNISAVIEEKSGTKSYWALAHPPEGPPDFHHPACFVLELPPANGA
jgi:hypothetical protein